MKKLSLLLLLILIQTSIAFSQHNTGDGTLTHEMTPEEMLRKHEIGRDFTPTPPPDGPVRMVAEFEHMQSVLIRYPFGIPMTLIKEMAEDCKVMTIVASSSQQQQVLNQYISAGVNTANCEWLIAPTDSYWTRDYGPWFVVNGDNEVGICDFPYNRPRPNDDNIPVVLSGQLDIELYGIPLVHTGGNWMCESFNGGGSTDLVWEENPGITHDSINSLVEQYLGVEKHHVLPDPLGEYIKHIDCWGKFLDVDKVLIGQVLPSDPRYADFEYVASYFSIRASAYGNNYQVYRVYTPGTFPNTPYTNSLILNKKVLVPITGSQYDDEALAAYEAAMPGYEVVGILASTWENTDALHCRAIGIADVGMLYIRHLPLLGVKPFGLEWEISAEIIPYSGFGLKSNELKLFYMVDSTDYVSVPLIFKDDHTYTATIPFQEPGSEIAYYIHAEDFSGRVNEHPYIGQPDPHVFTVDYATDAFTDTDTLIYLTVEEMIEGQTFNIINFTQGDLTINEIETEGDVFMWYTDPFPPTMPYVMSYGDTLPVNVKVALPVDGTYGYLVSDTLDFSTEFGTHKVIIKVDSDLLSKLDESSDSGFELISSVHPNPVRDIAMINLNIHEAGQVLVQVFDITGRLINVIENQYKSSGTYELTWACNQADGTRVAPGIYFVKAEGKNIVSSAKIIVAEP